MEQQLTSKQHYLPRYRIKHFLNEEHKIYIYSNVEHSKSRDRISGKNDDFFGVYNCLYERNDIKWEGYENSIETNLLARNIEPTDAKHIDAIIKRIEERQCVSYNNVQWLGQYALRMMYRSPGYIEEAKKEFKEADKYIEFIKFLQTDKHPNLTDEQWKQLKMELGLYSCGTKILYNPRKTFILPDSGFGKIIDSSTIILVTALSPSICMITSKGPHLALMRESGIIQTVTVNQIKRINHILFFSSLNEIASQKELSKEWLMAMKEAFAEFKANSDFTASSLFNV